MDENKFEPDDLIILDYLIYSKGNKAEINAWEKLKKIAAREGHKDLEN